MLSAQGPVVTEAARRAIDAEELHHTVEILSFTIVVLAALLFLDVIVEVYRMRERPPQGHR